MRRLFRHLFPFAAALSLLLCIAVSILWIRSYWLTDRLDWSTDGGWRSLRSAEGHLVVGLLLADWSEYPAASRRLLYLRDAPLPPVNAMIYTYPQVGDKYGSWQWGGFAWYDKRNQPQGTYHLIAVAPFWSIGAVTALLPLGWTALRLRFRLRARRRARLGLCLACGYDLRGAAAGGSCPECGVTVGGPSPSQPATPPIAQ